MKATLCKKYIVALLHCSVITVILGQNAKNKTISEVNNIRQSIPLKPEVIFKTPLGNYGPGISTSRAGREYYFFKGIPYAKPPVRFKDSQLIHPDCEGRNDDIIDATKYKKSCLQYNILSEEVEGDEDCLHLNIFVPKLPENKRSGKRRRYPVMVFFHQGAFMFGTSSDFKEKYMMDEDVVLVTVNYRLNVFGFLNTEGGSDAKGNQGLKDQVVALEFLQEYIHHFYGNPKLITIFGESAGAASVHYHLVNYANRGLFQRAISMSGTALSPWAFTRSPRKMAKKLGTLVNCSTSDMKELVNCLREIDGLSLAGKMKELYEWNTDPITPFAPSVEVDEGRSSFLTKTPYNLIKSGNILDVPWVLGVVENVCLLDAWFVLVYPELVADMNKDWNSIAPATFLYRETAFDPDEISSRIKKYYFGTKDVGNETAVNLTNLYSDRYFNHGIRTSALMHARAKDATPVYLYLFSYKGSQSHTKFAGISDIIGVSEGDDLRFLFDTNRFDDISLNTTDGNVSRDFVKLWVSFARNGKPTAVWSGKEWERITRNQAKEVETLKYYDLNEQCGFIDDPFSARLDFWDDIPLNENENELYNPIHRMEHADNFFESSE